MPTPDFGPVLHRFAHAPEMAQAAARWVVECLSRTLLTHARATLAVSGGKTPVRVWDLLCQMALPWSRVDITLVDERWVPPDHADSNERLIRQHLLQGHAAQASWMPLYLHGKTPQEAASMHSRHLPTVWHRPPDVLMLGMGEDGHTASWFPGSPTLLDEPGWCVPVALPALPNVQQPRVTLTPCALRGASSTLLLLEGQRKEPILAKALVPPKAMETALPVQWALWHLDSPVEVFYAP